MEAERRGPSTRWRGVHWYRNDGDEAGAFLCAVPTGDDAIELVEE